MKLSLPLATTATILIALTSTMSSTQAQTVRRVQTNSGEGVVKTVQGENGAAGCAGGVRYGKAGGKACAAKGQNGSVKGSSGVVEGDGAYKTRRGSYTNPTNGNSVSGSKQNIYNSQTDKGSSSTNRDATVNGSSYGYDKEKDYNYTPGSGGGSTTTIETENKGTYTCTGVTADGKPKTCTK
jgi:hypothetical protein